MTSQYAAFLNSKVGHEVIDADNMQELLDFASETIPGAIVSAILFGYMIAQEERKAPASVAPLTEAGPTKTNR